MTKPKTDPVADFAEGVLRLAWLGVVRLWRLLHPPRAPRGALVLGTAHPLHRPSDRSPFWITAEDRSRHIYVIGASGAGKTKALEGWIRQDIEAGRGCGVLDLHGDLVQRVLAFMADSPTARKRRLYLLDPSLRTAIPGFNPLSVAAGTAQFGQVMELVGVFKKIWAEFWGPRTEEILRNALLALQEHNLTILEFAPFLIDRGFRLSLVGRLQNPGAKEFWLGRFERLSRAAQAAYVEPVLNKAGAFTSDPYLRAVLAQRDGAIDFRRIMDRGDVLLVNLSKGVLKENALLLGALLVTKLQLAALSRAEQPEGRRRPFHLYIDEFQNFATETFGEILAEARKYGLSLVLAHQYLNQLSSRLRAAIFGNILVHVIFRISIRDARVVAQEVAHGYREEAERALIGLPNRQAIVRRRTDPARYAPWLLRPPFVADVPVTAGQVSEFKASALARRGKSIGEVEQEISDRWRGIGIRLGRREQPSRTLPEQAKQQLKEVA